jgi:hypothetical protein
MASTTAIISFSTLLSSISFIRTISSFDLVQSCLAFIFFYFFLLFNSDKHVYYLPVELRIAMRFIWGYLYMFICFLLQGKKA